MDMSIVFIAYVDEIVTRTGADVGTGALKVHAYTYIYEHRHV